MRFTTVASFALSSATTVLAASPLKLVDTYAGQTFFDGWNVNASLTDDANKGFIHYVDEATARSGGLINVNSAGNAIVKVDNTTSDPAPGPFSTFGRNTVLLISKDTINIGSLVVMDAVHIPFGCSVWPAFWTLDIKNGDLGGEIDIIETVNLMTTNQYSLHTKAGCSLTQSSSFSSSGKSIATNCDFQQPGNPGCSIQETASQNAVGPAFAKNGGGAYAMYWSTDGIQLWFFERSKIPSDITSGSPDPTSWGTPSAAFPASGCNPSSFFNPQSLIIDTDVCGFFAGNADVFKSTGCAAKGQCSDLVATASNYDDAYWEIKSIKTFSVTGGGGNSTGSGTPAGSAGGGAPKPSSLAVGTTTGTSLLAMLGSMLAGIAAVFL